MPEMERSFFLGFGFAALPLAVFGQSSQTEAPASGVPVHAGEDRFGKIRPIPTGSSTFKVSTQESHGGLFVMEHSNQKKGGPLAICTITKTSGSTWFKVNTSWRSAPSNIV